MKSKKKTNSFRPPLMDGPLAVGYRELFEESDWKWRVSKKNKAYR